MKEELIRLLENLLSSITDAKKKLSFIYQDQDLSEDGRKRKVDRIAADLAASSSQAADRIYLLINNKIDALNKEEHKALNQKHSDFAYLNRLRVKLELLSDMDKSNIQSDILSDFLSEFSNDPIAIGKIKSVIGGGMEYIGVLPTDNRNERQKRLASFKDDVWALIKNMSDLSEGGATSTIATFNNRLEYLKNQDEDFSIPDNIVAQNMKASGTFNFGFKHISEAQ